MPRITKPTHKMKVFSKEYIKSKGNGQESAKAAYNVTSDNTAKSLASQTLKHPLVIQEISKLMDSLDITDEYLVKKHKQLLEAHDIKGHPDHNIQSKALNTAYQVKGHIKSVGADNSISLTQINYYDKGERDRRLLELNTQLLDIES